MSELEQDKKRIVSEGKLQTVASHKYSGKKTHKQKMPLTSKKWSLKPEDYALLKFGFFFEMIEK